MADNISGMLVDFPTTPGAMAGGPAFAVAVYVIVSMLILVGIAYLIAQVLKNRKLEDWAKGEFLQVFISAALVGGLFLLMAPGTGVLVLAFNTLVPAQPAIPTIAGLIPVPIDACSSASMTDGTPICFAYVYLGALSAQIISLINIIFSTNIILDILAKVSIDVIIVQVTPLAGLSSIVQVLQSMIQSLLFLGIVVEVERALLIFVNKAALQLFLPIGIVLRTFFGTRRLGGALIALAVGAYLIFPLTIALNAISVNQVAANAFDPLVQLYNSAKSLDPMVEFFDSGAILSAEKWNGFLTNYVQTGKVMVDAIGSLPSIMTTAIALLVVQVVFLPILSVMLTMIAIKELAALFGSEINLSKFEV
jgi:hypothetical protein